MANNLITSGIVTKTALAVLENMLPFTKAVNREFQNTYSQKPGYTINIRKPPRYLPRSGELIQVQSSVETTVPLTLQMAGCDLSFSDIDLTLSIEDFTDRFIMPAMATVAQQIETVGMQLFNTVNGVVGTPGTPPATFLTFANANAYLTANGAPMDGQRSAILEPFAMASLADGLKGLFQSASEIDKQYKSGIVGRTAGFDFYESPSVQSFTAGLQGGAPVVNGAGQSGTSLVTNGWTAAAATRLNIGDTFTIANVYNVNPQTRQSTGKLQSFLVTAPGVSDGSGNMTIQIYPGIVASGQFQTTDSTPATNAAITVTSGTSGQVSKQNIAFHKNAFTFASVPLDLPNGTDWSKRVTSKSGISMRLVRDYDIQTNQRPTRIDVLFGFTTTRPELAVRVEG